MTSDCMAVVLPGNQKSESFITNMDFNKEIYSLSRALYYLVHSNPCQVPIFSNMASDWLAIVLPTNETPRLDNLG